MRRLPALAACLLLYLMPIHAQDNLPQPPSGGTYVTHVGGNRVMTETYRLASKPDGSVTAEAELTPAAGGAKQRALTVASRTRPESFSVEIGGATALEAKFAQGTVKLTVAGQAEREVRTKATVVLENLVWHQFVFLLGQYDHARGGRQNFTAFLPSQATEYPIGIEHAGAQTYTPTGGAPVLTHRYKIIAAGALALDMWTDKTRVPLLFEVEAQKIKVVRLGANKPFRDLAWGLASQGVAVLRYEKRTKQHGARMVAATPNLTVKEETIDDALAAVALLKKQPGVDAKKIFVLGHSLGGMLAPRIGAGDREITGFVLFAAATRPLEDEIVRQYEYLAATDGRVSDAERAAIQPAAGRTRAQTPHARLAGRARSQRHVGGFSQLAAGALRRQNGRLQILPEARPPLLRGRGRGERRGLRAPAQHPPIRRRRHRRVDQEELMNRFVTPAHRPFLSSPGLRLSAGRATLCGLIDLHIAQR